jgi:hypothetical protein
MFVSCVDPHLYTYTQAYQYTIYQKIHHITEKIGKTLGQIKSARHKDGREDWSHKRK